MADDTHSHGALPPTRWSLVARAACESTGTRITALDELLALYLPVLVRHLVHNLSVPDDRARDIAQSFVHDKILEQDLLAGADRDKGRFRSYLSRVFTNYARSQLRRDRAAKRRAMDAEAVRLDDDPDAVSVEQDPGTGFDLEWARQTLAEVLRRMQERCGRTGQTQSWAVFERRVLAPLLEGIEPADYDVLVRELEFSSPTQATNALLTAKRMFRRFLEDVVRDTVGDQVDVQKEIGELRAVLGKG